MQELTIYYTSDTHGFLLDTDYVTPGLPMGTLRLSSAFQKDGNTLVIDGGDTLQGSPLAQYLAEHPRPHHPIAEVMNAAGYDYVVPGNHDFNFGRQALDAYLQDLNAQCLCANVKDKTGRLPILPWSIHSLENGLRVGLAGITTEYITVWESEEHLAEFQVDSALEAARQALDQLRDNCDLTVCIYHGGFERDLDTDALLCDGDENVGWRICKELNFDLLLSAHQHMPLADKTVYGTHVVQPGPNATGYLQIKIRMENRTPVISSQLRPAPARSLTAPNALSLLEQEVQSWLDTPVGRLPTPIPAGDRLEEALCGAPLADFINAVQLSASGADISCTSLANVVHGLPAELTLRGIFAAYPYPNTLVTLEIDEASLREALERCAQYYTLEGGQPRISDAFLTPKVEHYNYDFFGGLDYTFDLRQPVGKRLVSLLFCGEPIGGKKLQLCTNNYRATGTGGYQVYQSLPITSRINTELYLLAVEHVRNGLRTTPQQGTMRVIWE